jgi:hypothetical protein
MDEFERSNFHRINFFNSLGFIAQRMTQPLGKPQGPLSFSPLSSAASAAGAVGAAFSTSAFFSVDANGFEIFAVLLL